MWLFGRCVLSELSLNIGIAAAMTSRVELDIKKMLDETGLDYEFQNGAKHRIVILAGKPIGCINRNSHNGGNFQKQFAALIRKRIRELS